MPSIINASTTAPGLVQSGDASGVLQLQSNGVTGLTVGAGGLLTAANGMVFSSMTLGTAIAGEFEYDGRVPYFTPLGIQRGVIPGMQFYRLESGLAGSNAIGNQNLFGVGCTVSANTVYAFEHLYVLTKTAGTTSHNLSYLFGGTATINNALWYTHYTNAGVGGGIPTATATSAIGVATNFTGTAGTNSITTASISFIFKGYGTVSISAGGTLIPQYNLSAAPGGAYTTTAGSYFLIYPIGAAGTNTSVGTWA